MSSQALQQYAFFTVVGALVAFVLHYIFVRAPRQRITEPVGWAQRRGIRYTPPVDFLGSARQGTEVCTFDGAVHGVGFEMRSSRLVNTRHAGINGKTEIQLRAAAPAPVAFALMLDQGPSVQAPDAVWTGDMPFTGLVRAHSDRVEAAAAWLAGSPPLRAAIVAAVRAGVPIEVRYQHGELRVVLPFPLAQESSLDAALGLVAPLGHARLG